MKRLRFHELQLMAESERTARAVKFEKLVTVVKGQNDRGKSCLIKSLYTALGATPKVVHPKWKALDVILHLRFSIDEIAYSILKVGRQFTLFNSQHEPIGKFSRITSGLGPRFADLFDFHLTLTNAKTRKPEQATPAMLFLPFYFDQDASWTESWSGFDNLAQFATYRKGVAEFHTGVRPNAYYQAKSKKAVSEQQREELRHDRAVVKRTLDKIEVMMKDAHYDLDLASYQNEIDLILTRSNELRLEEEAIKEEMVQLDTRRRSLERQIHITQEAANELGKDFTFAVEEMPDEVECPICGAEYHNSFVERFKIASDEDQLRAVLLDMQQELDSCMQRIADRMRIADDLSAKLDQIRSLLETKQGEIKLNDLLRNEGKKEVRVVLRNELNELNRDIGAADLDIEEAARSMKESTDKKRVAEIKNFYRERMSGFLSELDVTELDEPSYKEMDCRINESGSDKTRALLSFYFAILKTIEKYSTATFCPIVIDSARQQEQDTVHWRKMLDFMRDTRPSDAQMIVGLVDDLGTDLGGDVLVLTEERQLLRRSAYEEVAARLRPFLDESLKV